MMKFVIPVKNAVFGEKLLEIKPEMLAGVILSPTEATQDVTEQSAIILQHKKYAAVLNIKIKTGDCQKKARF